MKMNHMVFVYLGWEAGIIGCSNLSFGSTDRLMKDLGILPGAVTPLSMITGAKNDVSLF